MFHIACHIGKYAILLLICNWRESQQRGKVEYPTVRWGLFDSMESWDNTNLQPVHEQSDRLPEVTVGVLQGHRRSRRQF